MCRWSVASFTCKKKILHQIFLKYLRGVAMYGLCQRGLSAEAGARLQSSSKIFLEMYQVKH